MTTPSPKLYLLGALGLIGISVLACGGNAEETQKCDRTEVRVCDSKDPRKVYYVNTCGKNEEIAESCIGKYTCIASSATEAACGDASVQCTPTDARVCDDSDPRHVYSVDSCGGKKSASTCLGQYTCIASSATEAACGNANAQCTPTNTTVCDESDPKHVYSVDSCGNNKVRSTCLGQYTCIASSATEAACGDNSVQCTISDTTVCDENDPKHVFFVDSCGNNKVRSTCLGGAVCTASSATEAGCLDPADQCRPTTDNFCDPADPLHVYTVDTCGNKKAAKTCASEHFLCVATSPVDASCQCEVLDPPVLGCASEGYARIDNPTELGPIDACNQIVEVTQTCMMGERCWWDFDEQGMAISEPFCATSINPRHRAEPFYAKGCDLNIYMDAQTDLPIDCRCNRSGAIRECMKDVDAWSRGLRVGSGPHPRDINLVKWGGGFISKATKEMFVAVHYTGGAVDLKPGAIYAFNYETGDRRVVSGSYVDATGRHDVGSGYTVEGEALPFAVSAKLGADGNIYVNGSNTLNNVEITRVNPTTGARTLVWRRQTDAEGMNANFPFGQCFSGRVSPNYIGGFAPVQNAERAFALAPDGGFYLAWKNDGVGVVHISADGSTCRIVSRWASNNTTAPLPDIGGGITPQYGTISGMLYRDGKVYAETKDMLITIDVVTGDRAIFANVAGIGGVGETNFFVDEANQHLYACGTVAARKCSIHDLTNGNNAQGLFQIGKFQPLVQGKYGQIQGPKGALDNDNYTGFGMVTQDPDDANVLYFMILYALVKYEVNTGNSYIISM
jgi:hypothetical protein